MNKGVNMIYNTHDMIGQLSIALTELIDSGDWTKDDNLKVCIAGTLKKDKFIVIQNTTNRENKGTNKGETK